VSYGPALQCGTNSDTRKCSLILVHHPDKSIKLIDFGDNAHNTILNPQASSLQVFKSGLFKFDSLAMSGCIRPYTKILRDMGPFQITRDHWSAATPFGFGDEPWYKLQSLDERSECWRRMKPFAPRSAITKLPMNVPLFLLVSRNASNQPDCHRSQSLLKSCKPLLDIDRDTNFDKSSILGFDEIHNATRTSKTAKDHSSLDYAVNVLSVQDASRQNGTAAALPVPRTDWRKQAANL
jgi:hypothetical protein